MTRYILKWFIPAMGDWIKIGDYRRLDQAEGAEEHFRKIMRKDWIGELKTVIVEVVEREID